MGIFDDVGNAKTYESSKYFKDGQYLVSVENIKHLQQRGEKIVIECQVLGAKSSDPDAPEAGETAAHVISGFDAHDEKRDYALGDLKAFVQAVVGPVSQDWTPQQFGAFTKGIVGTALKGRCFMIIECWGKPLKRDPSKTFTVHTWKRKA